MSKYKVSCLGSLRQDILQEIQNAGFWNAESSWIILSPLPNSEILKIYWIFFQFGICDYSLCLMDKMKYARLIYQRLCLAVLPLLSQGKTYFQILISLYVLHVKLSIHFSQFPVNRIGCSQHTLNVTELELLLSFTLATNPKTAAAIIECLLFACTMPYYVQYFPC